MSKAPHSKWPPPEKTKVFRTHWLMRFSFFILLGACLILYLFVYRPAAVRADKAAQSLQNSYRNLVEMGFTRDSPTALFLKEAQRQRDSMIEIMHSLQQRMGSNDVFDRLFEDVFRVLEFEQRRFEILRDLEELADLSGARLPEDFNAMLPAYFDDENGIGSAELWLHLEFINHFLTHLLANDDGTYIELIEARKERRHDLGDEPEEMLEIRYRLKASSSALALANFLNAAALGTVVDKQPAIFFVEGIRIDHLQNKADSTTAARVDFNLDLCGFSKVPKTR